MIVTSEIGVLGNNYCCCRGFARFFENTCVDMGGGEVGLGSRVYPMSIVVYKNTPEDNVLKKIERKLNKIINQKLTVDHLHLSANYAGQLWVEGGLEVRNFEGATESPGQINCFIEIQGLRIVTEILIGSYYNLSFRNGKDQHILTD